VSDNIYRYVATEPAFQPSAAAAKEAETFLRAALGRAESVKARFSEHIEFVDAGENWEGVRCPDCGKDIEKWWGQAMNLAYDSNYELLVYQTECCGKDVSLNELDYPWPVAFASFVVEVFNPDSLGLGADEMSRLGALLGCSMREIRAHI
jgi:hypothetical protein